MKRSPITLNLFQPSRCEPCKVQKRVCFSTLEFSSLFGPRPPGGAIICGRFEAGNAVSLLQRVAVPRQSQLVEDRAVVDAPRPVQDVGRLEDLKPPRCCHGQFDIACATSRAIALTIYKTLAFIINFSRFSPRSENILAAAMLPSTPGGGVTEVSTTAFPCLPTGAQRRLTLRSDRPLGRNRICRNASNCHCMLLF